MHYYKRNIGDYAKKAGRLSMLQHGAYALLMDAIYDREKFPSLEDAVDWVWASSQDEIDAITFVLRKFFKEENGLFVQNRMQEEIEEYTAVCEANAINGKKGGRPKGSKNKAKLTQSVNSETQSLNLESEINPTESELKPKPLTTNHKPLTNIKDLSATPPVKWDRNRFKSELINLGVDPSIASDWMKTRKTFTETSFKGTVKQITLSNLSPNEAVTIAAESGWKGFKAEYVQGRTIAPIGGGRGNKGPGLIVIPNDQPEPLNSNLIEGEIQDAF